MTKKNRKVDRNLIISLLLLLILAITSTTVSASTTPPPDGNVRVIYYTSTGENSGGGTSKPDKGVFINKPPVGVLELPNPAGETVHLLKSYTGVPQMKLPATGGHSLLLGTLTLLGLLSLGVYTYSNKKTHASN